MRFSATQGWSSFFSGVNTDLLIPPVPKGGMMMEAAARGAIMHKASKLLANTTILTQEAFGLRQSINT